MYVCMYACMYVCMYVWMYVCTYVCTYVWVCVCVCVYVNKLSYLIYADDTTIHFNQEDFPELKRSTPVNTKLIKKKYMALKKLSLNVEKMFL